MQTINAIAAALGQALAAIGRAIGAYWRPVLAGLPLPMLALAASYGVYSYAKLFVPEWVAIAQAAAFELTYIGLAVLAGLSERQRGRARAISIGAVLASIIYNTLAGWFHQRPGLIETASNEAWLMLAILHGLPLAWVAYLVSDLLLHRDQVDPDEAEIGSWERRRRDRADRFRTPQIAPQGVAATAVHDSSASGNIGADRGGYLDDEQFVDWLLDEAGVPPVPAPEPARDYTCKHCRQGGLTSAELMAHGRRHKRHGSCQGVAVSAAD